MSEIQREAQRWGVMYAGLLEGVSAIGNQISAGFRRAAEAMREDQRARLLLGDDVDVALVMERARTVSLQTALSYPEALRREVDAVLHPTGATFARACGWHDLADVIQNQEGRQIVRDGLRDVRVWLGEVRP